MQNPRSLRRAQSLDKPHTPRKALESPSCQYLSLPSTPCRQAPSRAVSDAARRVQSPALSSGAWGSGAAAAHTLEETRGFLPSEQRPPPDTKKDKAQRWAQQGWLKTVLNFLLRTGSEEPKDKASRRPKGIEEPTEPPEAAEELALRKKAQDKKASRKKYSHRKHGAEDAKGTHDQEAGGHEARLPKMPTTLRSEEAKVGPVHRGGQDSLSSEAAGTGHWGISPQATGPQPEEECEKPDQDAVIRMIVEFLRKVGDRWEEEQLQALQPAALLQTPAPACRKKSQEKKPSCLKRAFSLKKCSPEESRRAGAADAPSPEARPPKRPSFLPLCVGGHRLSTSSSPGCERPGTREALSADGDGPHLSELPTRAGHQGPGGDLPLDGASESSEFMQKLLALLQEEEEPAGGQQPRVKEAEAAVESLAPPCRRKSQEKPSSLRRAFSHRSHSSKEPRRAGAAGTVRAATPEPRPPKRPGFLPLCVGGHQPSDAWSSDAEGPEFQEPSATAGSALGASEAASQARSCTPEGAPPQEEACKSKELLIRKLVALLQEVDGELGKQIRRHPSFKRFLYKFSDSSLRKLVATLCSQKPHSPDRDRSLPKRLFPFAFGAGNKYSHSRTICSLMGSRGHYEQQSDTQILSREAQPNLASPECQSPD